MPYVCMIRTDIDNGTLQLLDLWPNTSQAHPVGPHGQTKYVNRGEFTGAGRNAANGRPTTLAAAGNVTLYDTYGLAAYIADNVGSTISGLTVPAAIANLMATAIMNLMDTGAALALATINTTMQGVAGAQGDETLTSAGGTGSVGSLADVLQICAGGSYLLPAGSPENVTTVGYAAAGAMTPNYFRHSYDTGAFAISFAGGELNELLDATYSYEGTAGAAVSVLADDGSVYA